MKETHVETAEKQEVNEKTTWLQVKQYFADQLKLKYSSEKSQQQKGRFFRILRERQHHVALLTEAFNNGEFSDPETRAMIIRRRILNELESSENNAFEKASQLQKDLSKPVMVANSIYEAFDKNISSRGKSFYISDDDFTDISVAAVQMISKLVRDYPVEYIKKGAAVKIEKANLFAKDTYEKIREIKENFVQTNKKLTLDAIANDLNKKGIELPRGGTEWTATSVRRIINRFEKPEPK